MRIVVAGLKGGVGRTTTCIHLACALERYRERPRRIGLFDWHDGATSQWYREAAKAGTPLPLTLGIVGTTDEAGFDDLVIDTPPHLPGLLAEIVTPNDVVLLPTSPSSMELESLGETARYVRNEGHGASNILVLLTRFDTNDTEVRSRVNTYLAGRWRLALCQSVIPYSELIEDSWGAYPALSGYDRLIRELSLTRQRS